MVRVVRCQRREDRPLGGGRVLQLVDHQVREAAGDLGADVFPLAQELVEDEEDVAVVEVAGGGEDAVVGGAELGEVRFGRLGAGLELVGLSQEPGEQSGRVAPYLLVAQGQVVEAVEQHREALAAPEHVEEGVEAGGGRVLPQQPLAELPPGADPELLGGAPEQRFGAPSKAPHRRRVRGEEQDPLGVDAVAGQGSEAPRQRLGLAGSGRAQQQERAIAVLDRAFLSLGKREHVPTLASARPP